MSCWGAPKGAGLGEACGTGGWMQGGTQRGAHMAPKFKGWLSATVTHQDLDPVLLCTSPGACPLFRP